MVLFASMKIIGTHAASYHCVVLVYQGYPKSIEPKRPNQIYKTESRKSNLPQTKCVKCNAPNIPNQIYLINPTKVNPTNSSKLNLRKIEVKFILA